MDAGEKAAKAQPLQVSQDLFQVALGAVKRCSAEVDQGKVEAGKRCRPPSAGPSRIVSARR